MRVATEIVLTHEERAELTRLVRSKRTSVRLALRANIVLLAASGRQNKDIAVELSVGRVQVARWRERYAQSRLAGIERDLPRGAPPTKVDDARLVELTTQSKPFGGLYRWVSCPNYLGEILEWSGWALATWSWPGLAFAVFTFANLAPRALSTHRWYRETFADYPPERKALVPFVL